MNGTLTGTGQVGAFALCVMLNVSVVGGVDAQNIVIIRDSATCTTCIEFEPVLTLMGSDSVPLSRPSKAVAFESSYVVTPTYAPSQVAVYATDGTLIETVGRPGQGPGEFAAGSALKIARGSEDSIFVVERNRWHVFSPEREFVRTTILPASPVFVAASPDGMLLGAFPWQATNGRIYTVSMMNSSGRVVRSFDRPRDEEPDDPWTTLRMVESYEGALWTGRINRIEIRRQPLDNDSVPVVWRRTNGWFPGWEGYNGREPFYERPRPQMTGFGATADVIWIFAQRADQNWRALRAENANGGRERPRAAGEVEPETVFDGVIEAVDRVTGVVLGRRETDEVWHAVSGRPDFAQRTRLLESGNVALEVVRLVLVDKGQKGYPN